MGQFNNYSGQSLSNFAPGQQFLTLYFSSELFEYKKIIIIYLIKINFDNSRFPDKLNNKIKALIIIMVPMMFHDRDIIIKKRNV